jgi:hypothetical protein
MSVIGYSRGVFYQSELGGRLRGDFVTGLNELELRQRVSLNKRVIEGATGVLRNELCMRDFSTSLCQPESALRVHA